MNHLSKAFLDDGLWLLASSWEVHIIIYQIAFRLSYQEMHFMHFFCVHSLPLMLLNIVLHAYETKGCVVIEDAK